MDEVSKKPPSPVDPIDPSQLPVPRIGKDGTPVYDQQFFLALARCGKDVWNAWRAEHPPDSSRYYIVVNFGSVDFRAMNERFDFAGYDFGHWADLFGATFGDQAKLSGAAFGRNANLRGATFGDDADLSGATFGVGANLAGATFGDRADLSGAVFGRDADLSGTTFGDGARFNGWSPAQRAEFGTKPEGTTAADPNGFYSVRFAGARFLGDVDFSGRVFTGIADFSVAQFGEPPQFDSLANIDLYGGKVSFYGDVPGWTARSDVATRLRHLRKLADDAKNHDLERDLYIEERKAERGIYLLGYLSAARRDIAHREQAATGAWSTAAFRAYVVSRLITTAAGLLTHLGWFAVMFLYWLLADYGRSFMRPLVALALSIVLFHAAYWLALHPVSTPGFRQRATAAFVKAIAWPQQSDPPLVRANRAFALANAVPFVGALTLDKDIKERMICGDQPVDETKAAALRVPPCLPIPPLRFQLLALLQTIVSTACVFFIALALRNYFRVR